mmetsp:Transcript_145904/g.363805  ORF Transcript_145904/g.363805 Transcript_145904/m.363805 type:complete len:195 (-) Transcript_145904:1110-1694(-)
MSKAAKAMQSYATLHAPPPAQQHRRPRVSAEHHGELREQSSLLVGATGGSSPRQRRLEKLLAEGTTACLERLDSQMHILGTQVSKAVRAVGLVQDIVYELEARLASLEFQDQGAFRADHPSLVSTTVGHPGGHLSSRAIAGAGSGGGGGGSGGGSASGLALMFDVLVLGEPASSAAGCAASAPLVAKTLLCTSV